MKYDKQDRGQQSSYAQYYRSMNQVMAQKIAYITSLFPRQGKILDMGCGSGQGSFDLANLFPEAEVTGIDINPQSVAHCIENYKKDNLNFSEGDISKSLYPEKSIDGILNSSVIHHVTSFNNFDKNLAHELIKNQSLQLKDGGVLCIRDFLAPDENEPVYLTLLKNDGNKGNDVIKCSSAKLFEIFCKNFKCSAYPNGNIPYDIVEEHQTSITFEVELRLANEFILRKDYREHWDVELQEEYTYFTRSEFEQSVTDAGLSILISKPIYNQWIINERWKNQVRLVTRTGQKINLPTNYIIIAKKITHPKIEKISTRNIIDPEFLKFSQFIHEKTGETFDLVSRPQPTVDIIPFYKNKKGEVIILARANYPRPLISTHRDIRLDEATISNYIIEPITCVMKDPNAWGVKSEVIERLGINRDDIKEVTKALEYYPSPGGTAEKVISYLVEIKNPKKPLVPTKNTSGFNYSGEIKPLEIQQLLRSYQMGAHCDSRLEMNVYFLLNHLEIDRDPWIEETLNPAKLEVIGSTEKADLTERKMFRSRERRKHPNYLKVQSSIFSDGINRLTLEQVVPEKRGDNTLSIIPVGKNSDNELVIGLELRDLPSIQIGEKNSLLLNNPCWRVPRDVAPNKVLNFLENKCKVEFSSELMEILPLGGSYYPSPGTSAENVSVYIAYIKWTPNLYWIKASDLFKNIPKYKDGHLMTALYRLSHALDKK